MPKNYFFLSIAEKLKFLFPNLERSIIQAEMDINPIVLISRSLKSALILSLIISSSLIFLGIYSKTKMWLFGIILFPIILIFSFFSNVSLPERMVKRRMRDLEKDLPYALRNMLIEVKSGIPLYNAMVSVSEGYGEVSHEFKRIVKEIGTGKSEIEALENAILRNPSLQFRRSLWQLISALESGANISSTLESLVASIVESQIIEVRKYGRELNPFTLIYMLMGVVLPSLGVTFLMILSSFTSMTIGKETFYMILGFLVIFQYMFLNLVKSKRPVVKV